MTCISCFLVVFCPKREKNMIFQTDFQGKPIIPAGMDEKSCKQREPMVRLRRTLNSKRYHAEVLQKLQRSLLEYSQRYSNVSLKSLQNPTQFLESYIYFGIPKKNRKWNPRIQIWNPFFFRLESHGIRRFFPWNPKESRRFFLESQGIYTSLPESRFLAFETRFLTPGSNFLSILAS